MLKGQFFTKNIPIMRKDVRIEAKYCVFEPIDVGSAAPEAVLRTLEALVASVEASTERAQLASSEDAAAPILQPPAASSDTDAVPAAAADPAAAAAAADPVAAAAATTDPVAAAAAAADPAAPATADASPDRAAGGAEGGAAGGAESPFRSYVRHRPFGCADGDTPTDDAMLTWRAAPAAAPNAARTAAPNAAPIDLAVGDAAAASTAAPAHGSAEQAAQECLPSPPLRTTARAARAARAAAGSGGSAVRRFRAMVCGISGR